MQYSPSSTTRYQQCPRLYDLGKRWQAKQTIVSWTPNMLMGTAIAKGLEWHYADMIPEGLGGKTPLDGVKEVIEKGYVPNEQWPLETLLAMAARGLKKAIKTGFPLGGEILDVEEEVNGRVPDLVYRTRTGDICVVDHKVTFRLPSDYVGNTLMMYETSWQLADYAYFVGQKYGEPVKQTGIHLIVLSPRCEAYVHWLDEWTPEKLAKWRSQARQWWLLIERSHGLSMYPENWQHCQRFGSQRRCEFYTACHNLNGDESRMGAFYDKRPLDG